MAKREYWTALIGKQVSAKNYRDETGTGVLLDVISGVWGYCGDSVALVLDIKDSRGLDFWPAGLCSATDEAAAVATH